MSWQEIKTAPRDGSRVLIALKFSGTNPYFVGRVRVARWKQGRWSEGAGQFWDDGALCAWQPMPEAPDVKFVAVANGQASLKED